MTFCIQVIRAWSAPILALMMSAHVLAAVGIYADLIGIWQFHFGSGSNQGQQESGSPQLDREPVRPQSGSVAAVGRPLSAVESHPTRREKDTGTRSTGRNATTEQLESIASTPSRQPAEQLASPVPIAAQQPKGADHNSASAPLQRASLAGYFSVRAAGRTGLLTRHPDLRIDIHEVRANPRAGNGVATCEVDAEVSDRQQRLVYFNTFAGQALYGPAAEIGTMACQAAIDNVLAHTDRG